jgi:hypothetical protein
MSDAQFPFSSQVDFAAAAIVTLPRCYDQAAGAKKADSALGRAFHVVNTNPEPVSFGGKEEEIDWNNEREGERKREKRREDSQEGRENRREKLRR